MSHSFKLHWYESINFDEKCNYCQLSIRQILVKTEYLYKTFTYKQLINSVPCLTEDEWIIKSIIE